MSEHDIKLQIKEAEFLSQVTELLEMFRWRWCHFRPARTKDGWRTALSGDKGFPDIVAIKELNGGSVRLLFIELKREQGKLTEAQKGWLDLLNKVAGVETYVWYPHNWNEICNSLIEMVGEQI